MYISVTQENKMVKYKCYSVEQKWLSITVIFVIEELVSCQKFRVEDSS